ncbi:MAG: alanine--tRNA ligase [Patescibacteria group bacterium]
MTAHEIRQKYLDFFKSKGHVVLPSAKLVPENDPTTLFTGSGMQPMVPFLLGEAHPQGTRLADSQKCFRAKDIEEVGDNRHTTFFEMLGNWSLGDYFKKEQIPWMFEFLTEVVGLDPEKLYVTCFIGAPEYDIPKDTEAAEIWQKLFAEKKITAEIADIGSQEAGSDRGMKSDERIFYYDGKKNWWSRNGGPDTTPVGDPCGPDSEMFFDFGTPHDERFGKNCHPNCDCGRFMEIGNNVFMTYRKEAEGKFIPLQKPNIDHGSGLERIAAAEEGSGDMFRISFFAPVIQTLETLSGKRYGDEPAPMRVIADHLRAATFLIADGIVPSNKDQGYFVRRLIRRSVRFAHKLGVKENFAASVAEAYVQTYEGAYPELLTKKDMVMTELTKEEQKFRQSLDKGLKEFEKLFSAQGSVSGIDAFNLYQSYGFPWELTEELAREKGQEVDKTAFEAEFKKHQDLSRAGSEKKFAGGLADTSEQSVKYHTATHLLHQALRTVLGDHVEQRGSNITPERLRFDFSHGEKMTAEQIKATEDIVNEQIKKDLPVHFEMLTVEEAKARGAIGLFEDKYAQLGDQIKVYFVGDDMKGYFSKEICGGPHVDQTGTMGHFTIAKEEASSAGIRRIKAILE